MPSKQSDIPTIWVTDGVDRCHVGFLMRHMVKHAVRYDGALAQVTRVFSDNEKECCREERRMFHAKRGLCYATIISCLPEMKSRKYVVAKGRRNDDAFINSDDEKYSNY